MKKLVLFAIVFFYITNTFAQTYCTTSYLYGCNYMGIENIVIDSATVNIANTGTLSTGCQHPTSGYTDFTGSPNLGTLYIGKTYSTTITTNGNYSQHVGVFVDINQNDNFSDAGEFLGTTHIFGTESQLINIKIPSNAKLGKTRMRIISNYYNDGMDQNTPCNTNLSYGETEDYTINIATMPMKYGSSTTNAIPNGTMVYPGNTNQYVLQVQVEMNGTLNPLTAKNLTFSTDGTNNFASIKNAKLWYTGNSFTLDYKTQVGLAFDSPQGKFVIDGSQALIGGTNVFWLTYDIADNALVSDTLKATFESLDIDGKTYTPTLNSPLTNGLMVDYTNNIFDNTCYNSAPQNTKDIIIGNYDNSNINCSGADQNNYYPPSYYYYVYAYQGGNTNYSITNAAQALNYGIYIDFNKDGLYTGAGEFIDVGLVKANQNINGFLKIPAGAVLGINRLRIICSNEILTKNSFAIHAKIGEAHDYKFNVSPPSAMAINSSYYYKEGNLVAPIPSINNEILKFNVNTNGSSKPISVAKLTFNTLKTAIANIENAKIWYGGVNGQLNYAKQVGNIVVKPNGDFTFDANIMLADQSNNYFWLTYDVPVGAQDSEKLDASIVVVTDNNGKEIKFTADESNSSFPDNILGSRITANTFDQKDETVKTCSAVFYDNGGKDGKMIRDKDHTTVIKANDPNSFVRLTFTQLDFGYDAQGSSDFIEIYDGTTLLAQLNHYNQNLQTFTSGSDSLTIKFLLNQDQSFIPTLGGDGWEATVSCVYNCEKNPLLFNATSTTPTCANDYHKVTLNITEGLFPPFNYSINGVFHSSTKETLDTLFKAGSYSINIENNKGCSTANTLSLIDPYSNISNKYYIYPTYPSCNKGEDGIINIGAFTEITPNIQWNTGKETGASFTIPHLKYLEKVAITLTDANSCVVDSVFLNTNDFEGGFDPNNDTSNYLVANAAPVVSDVDFSVGTITQSTIHIKLLNNNANNEIINTAKIAVSNPNYSGKTILPDAIHWIVSPAKAANITPNDTMASALWNNQFSGVLKIKAEPMKGVCRGYMSPETEITIRPLANMVSKDTLSIFKGDSAKITLNLYGSKPFKVLYALAYSNTTDTIHGITTSPYSFYIKNAGDFAIRGVLDSSMTTSVWDSTFTVVIDRVRNVSTVVNDPNCHNQKSKVDFSFVGGKAPYEIHLADTLDDKFSILKTAIPLADTLLANGGYYFRIVDANKDTSKAYILNIQDIIPELGTPKISAEPYSIPVNDNPQSFKVNAIPNATSYTWLSNNAVLAATKDNSTTASYTMGINKSGKATIRVIAQNDKGCKSDTSYGITITVIPTAKISITDTRLFYNEKDSIRVSMTGANPWSFAMNHNGMNDTISNIVTPDYFYKISKTAKYYLVYAEDQDKIRAKFLSDTIFTTIDTITTATVKATSPACIGKKGNITVTGVTGGKTPYRYYYYSSTKGFATLSSDTALLAGNYKVSIIDAAGFEIATPYLVTIDNSQAPIAATSITEPNNNLKITIDTLQTHVVCKAIAGITKYGWILSPANAGSLKDSNNTSSIQWNANFSGNAVLAVVGVTAEGCISDTSTKVTIQRSGALVSLVSDKTKIYANDSATIMAAFAGVAPYQFCYSLGSTPTCIDGISTSTYSFKIRGTGDFVVTSIKDKDLVLMENKTSNTISLSIDTITTATVKATSPACIGKKGSIKVTGVTGGKIPYRYYYYTSTKDFATLSSDTALLAGNYQVSIIDAAGFEIATPYLVTIDNSQAPIAATSITEPNNNLKITIDTLQTHVVCKAIAGITKYGWILSPANAGSLKDSSNSSSIQWNTNFSGNAVLAVVGVTAEGCISDTSTKVTIQRSGALVSLVSDKTKIYANDSATITAEFAGASPYQLCYTLGSTPTCIDGISTSTYSFKIRGTGDFVVTSIKDKDLVLMENKTSNTISLSIDTITTATVNATSPACIGKKGNITVTGVTGGKTPYRYYYYTSTKDFATLSSDTALLAGNYKVSIIDAAGFEIATPYLATLDNSQAPIAATSITEPINNLKITIDTLQTHVVCNPIAGITKYGWILSPANAGSLKDSNNTSSIQWNANFSGNAVLAVVGATAEGCISDTSTKVTIQRSGALVSLVSDKTKIYANDSATITAAFAGSAPYQFCYSLGSTPTCIDGITTSTYSFKIKTTGDLLVITIKDKDLVLMENKTSNTISLSIDTITTATVKAISPVCTGKKGSISVTEVTGGKTPYRYYYYTSTKGFATLSSDTALLAGNYKVSIIDAAGFEIATPYLVTIDNSQAPIAATSITEPINNLKITIDTLQTHVVCKSIAGITKYGWILSPANAGSLKDSNNTSSIQWNANFSGNAVLAVVGVTAEGCISDTSTKVNIQRSGALVSLVSDKTKIYANDSATITAAFAGAAPYQFCYSLGSTPTCIDGITTSTYSFKIKTTGDLLVITIKDKDLVLMENKTSNTISITSDTLATAEAIIVQQAACAADKGQLKFTFTGGASPFQCFITNLNTSKIDTLSGIKSDDIITLTTGDYSFKFKDNAGNISKWTTTATLSNLNFDTLKPIVHYNVPGDTVTNGPKSCTVFNGSLTGYSNLNYQWLLNPTNGGTSTGMNAESKAIYWDKKYSGKAVVGLVVNNGVCYSDTTFISIKVKANIITTQLSTSVDIKTYGRGPFDIYIGNNAGQSNFVSTGDTVINFGNNTRIDFIKMIDLSTGEITYINQGFTNPTPISPISLTVQNVKIYDGFSPNGDGKNDLFVIHNFDLNSPSTLSIVNELGFEVYRSENYQNDWSGVDKNNNDLKEGVYICQFIYHGKTYSQPIEIRR